MPPIRIPWGPEPALELALPTSGPLAEADIDVVWPDLSEPLGDYQGALSRAIDSPVGAQRLEELVKAGSTVAIVVDDPSRWTAVREALPIVLERLHSAGIRREDVTISVGVGRHAAVDKEAMRRRVGEEVAESYGCFSPPVDDLSAYDELGLTPGGIPVRVFRPVARADLRILIGSVLPHLQAGFGGGYKLIFPGASHRTTLGALHRQGLDGSRDPAGLLGGRAGENPMRQVIHAAAAMLGPCWSISQLTGGSGEVLRIVAGHPEVVQDQLAEEARCRLEAPDAPPADVVIAGNDPWPGDPMQSFKVLLHHRAASVAGGVLIGMFWTDENEIDRSFPIKALRQIAVTGRLGGWGLRRILPAVHRVADRLGSPAAFMLRWARELVVDRTVLIYAPPLFARVGPRLGPVQLFADQNVLWRAAEAAAEHNRSKNGGGNLRVRVFPRGGLTYVPSQRCV
jgi:lactate racemase